MVEWSASAVLSYPFQQSGVVVGVPVENLSGLRVVHLGRSTCQAISGRGHLLENHSGSVNRASLFSSSLLSSLELSDTNSMGLKYEPSSEPLHISAK